MDTRILPLLMLTMSPSLLVKTISTGVRGISHSSCIGRMILRGSRFIGFDDSPSQVQPQDSRQKTEFDVLRLCTASHICALLLRGYFARIRL